MQKLAKETGEQVQIQMRNVQMKERKEEATERAFTDIHSMIQQFRHERASSKERLQASQRGNSGGRYNNSSQAMDDGSPSNGLMRSGRHSSGSPDAWQRRRISPVRNHHQ